MSVACGYRTAAFRSGEWGYAECDLPAGHYNDHRLVSFVSDGGVQRAKEAPRAIGQNASPGPPGAPRCPECDRMTYREGHAPGCKHGQEVERVRAAEQASRRCIEEGHAHLPGNHPRVVACGWCQP